MDRNPPILNHNSRGRSTSSCNCGRKQAPREDPFDVQAANYDFYQVRIRSAHAAVTESVESRCRSFVEVA